MKELWKVFRDSKTSAELGAYTMRGTFDGEEQATKELLAHDKDIPAEQIITTIENRAKSQN